MGGSSEHYAFAMAIHPISGEVYIAGHSTLSDLPVTGGGAQPAKVGAVAMNDAFMSRFLLDLASGRKVPAAFAFTPKLNVPLNSPQSSNGVQNLRRDGQRAGECRRRQFCAVMPVAQRGLGCDVQAFGSVATTMHNSQYVCARQATPSNTPAQVKAPLEVGGGWAAYVVSTCSVFTSCSLDIEGSSGAPNALPDGLMQVRATLGFTGTAVTTGAIIGTPPRNT